MTQGLTAFSKTTTVAIATTEKQITFLPTATLDSITQMTSGAMRKNAGGRSNWTLTPNRRGWLCGESGRQEAIFHNLLRLPIAGSEETVEGREAWGPNPNRTKKSWGQFPKKARFPGNARGVNYCKWLIDRILRIIHRQVLDWP
jgi:hypothetical protein